MSVDASRSHIVMETALMRESRLARGGVQSPLRTRRSLPKNPSVRVERSPPVVIV